VKKTQAEKTAQTDLWELETQLHSEGLNLICGVDEAGRGPLAGPVCAAAVILPQGFLPAGLNDSKKLSEKKRELLFPQIQETAVAWSIAFASVEEIERDNILQATFLAMNRAIAGLKPQPEYALIDGNRSREILIPNRCVIGGDGRVASIAAASILAKVSRDHLMLELAEEYPEYGFEKHKGYGTKAHYEALRKYGPSPVHRMSFLKSAGF
jgi:ribonuclease HII